MTKRLGMGKEKKKPKTIFTRALSEEARKALEEAMEKKKDYSKKRPQGGWKD